MRIGRSKSAPVFGTSEPGKIITHAGAAHAAEVAARDIGPPSPQDRARSNWTLARAVFGRKTAPQRGILDFSGPEVREGPTPAPQFQKDSGLSQGFAGRGAAG